MKIAGVIVTYNRKELLEKNIISLLKQTILLDKIIIIDNNSTDKTKEHLLEKGYLNNEKIEYIYLNSNIGGAGGFSFGTKYAYENNYDFICLMDDDGRPYDKYSIERILDAAKKVYNVEKKIMLNSLVIERDERLSFGLNELRTMKDAIKIADNNIIRNAINPFNGTLISKELIDKIGFPNKDFFIKGDETDYMNRAIKNKAFVATVTDSLYYHPSLERKYKDFLGRKIEVSVEAPWKEYYRARNYVYMFKKSGEYMNLIKQPLIQIRNVILTDCPKLKSIKMILRGVFDGMTSRLGAQIKP